MEIEVKLVVVSEIYLDIYSIKIPAENETGCVALIFSWRYETYNKSQGLIKKTLAKH